MKKSLLILALAAIMAPFACAQASGTWRAGNVKQKTNAAPLATQENSVVFGYCGDYSDGLGTGSVGVTLKGAIGLAKTQANKYKGNKITKVRIGYGNSTNKDITLFISKTLAGTPVYTQNATLSTLNGWNEIELTTPYEIDGSVFYVGYQTVTKATSDYPIGVDGIPTATQMADNVAVNNSWSHIGSEFGSICIRLVIAGENIPEYEIVVTDSDVPGAVKLNSPFDVSFEIRNDGAATITEIGTTCTIDGNTVVPAEVSIEPAAVESGEYGAVTLKGLVYDKEGISMPMVVAVNSINGNAYSVPKAVSATVSCAENIYRRNVVVEEWTGTWCGWCPRGIVGMAYMEENYGDDGFIGIAVHGGDVMETASYSAFLSRYASGYPGCIMNRKIMFDPSADALEYYYRQQSATGGLVNVTLQAAAYDDKPGEITLKGVTNYSFSNNMSPYKLAFVLVEDGVGPYPQQNYYANGAAGVMGGWESLAARVNTTFNHVARDIFTVYGMDDLIPTEIEKNVAYDYETTISSAKASNLDNCHVVALLINSATGDIENATKASISRQAGVGNVSTDSSVAISPVAGGIAISGNCDRCTVYGLDGCIVASGAASDFIALPAGVYVVKATSSNNTTVAKILVK